MPGDRLRVNERVAIPRAEIEVRFSASGGPGGQHANKAATRVELSFDAEASPSLTASQRNRIVRRLGPVVRVVADDERSQRRNRVLAEDRLAARLAGALHVAKRRTATKPTRGSQRRRLDAKRRRSDTKANRRTPRHDD